MLTFFELVDDLSLKGRWYINTLSDANGIEIDSREFNYGRSVDLGPPIIAKKWQDGTPVAAQPPLKIALDRKRKGAPLDFTFTNANLPVATSKVGKLLDSISTQDIQRIPVLIENQKEEYSIINVTSVIDCIDIRRSKIEWYQEGNKIRPDKAGKPFSVANLVIDPMKVGKHHIFRLNGWEVVIIVSNRVKETFEESRVSGIRFHQVSP